MTTKAVFKGIVTRTARLNNLDQADSGGEQSSLQKVFSIKGLSEGKELTDAQLAKINTYAIVPLKKEEVHYVQLLMAHNGIDRDVERFDEELLADFARTLPGKGFFVEGHPGGWSGHGGPGEGLHFDTRVVQMTPEEFMAKTNEAIKLPEGVSTVSALMSDAYILALDSNSDTRKKINAGIIRFSSIGFKAPFYSITDDNGNHIYGEYRPKGEALEGSLVWLGAQPGAGVMKGLKPPEAAQSATAPGAFTASPSLRPPPERRALLQLNRRSSTGSTSAPGPIRCPRPRWPSGRMLPTVPRRPGEQERLEDRRVCPQPHQADFPALPVHLSELSLQVDQRGRDRARIELLGQEEPGLEHSCHHEGYEQQGHDRPARDHGRADRIWH